jgi:hypothetical protein
MPALAMAFGIAIAGDVVKSSGAYANLMDQKTMPLYGYGDCDNHLIHLKLKT